MTYWTVHEVHHLNKGSWAPRHSFPHSHPHEIPLCDEWLPIVSPQACWCRFSIVHSHRRTGLNTDGSAGWRNGKGRAVKEITINPHARVNVCVCVSMWNGFGISNGSSIERCEKPRISAHHRVARCRKRANPGPPESCSSFPRCTKDTEKGGEVRTQGYWLSCEGVKVPVCESAWRGGGRNDDVSVGKVK